MTMADSMTYKLVVSDELGFLRVVEAPSSSRWSEARVVQRWGEGSKDAAITAMAVCPEVNVEGSQLVAVARRKGNLEVVSSTSGSPLGACPPDSTKGSEVADQVVTAAAFLPITGAQSESPRLLSCTQSGLLRIHQKAPSSSPATEAQPPSWACLTQFHTCPSVLTLALDHEGSRAAVGGEGCQISIFDLNTKQRMFKGKGPKPDHLGLVEPPFLTASTFLPASNPYQVLVGTVKHKLLMYDIRVGQRPQMKVDWGEFRVTCLQPSALEGGTHLVWCSNAGGAVQALDLRTNKMQSRLQGAKGSVRDLARHPAGPWVATVGLDRFLRVYHESTRELVVKVYLKQPLTAVSFLADRATEAPQKGPEAENGSDEAGQENGDEAEDVEAGDHSDMKGKRKRRGSLDMVKNTRKLTKKVKKTTKKRVKG